MNLVLVTVAFLLELAVLAAAGAWAFGLATHLAVQVLLAVLAVALLATLWGVFGSPRAVVPLVGVVSALFRVAWFGTGALLAGLRFGWPAGLALAGVYAVDALALLLSRGGAKE